MTSATPPDIQHLSSYVQTMDALLHRLDLHAVERAVRCLRDTRDRGGTVFVAGNGGSSATASHFVNDLGKWTKQSGRTPMRAMSLSDNTPWLTALGNDEGYERIFAGQLENFARPGDVLVVISASGNSPNLVRAVETAQQSGVTTIGFLGFDGGVLKHQVDDCVWIRTERGLYGPVEDCHAMLCHMIAACLAADRAPSPAESVRAS